MKIFVGYYFVLSNTTNELSDTIYAIKTYSLHPNYCNKKPFTIAHTKICSVKFNGKGSFHRRHLCTQQRIQLPLALRHTHIQTCVYVYVWLMLRFGLLTTLLLLFHLLHFHRHVSNSCNCRLSFWRALPLLRTRVFFWKVAACIAGFAITRCLHKHTYIHV